MGTRRGAEVAVVARVVVVGVACASVVVSSWSPVAAVGASVQTSLVGAPVAPGDVVADVPSRPLGSLPEPVDPADAIDVLPDPVAALPDDGSSVVDPGATWTSVAGLPVKVREDSTVAPVPTARGRSVVRGMPVESGPVEVSVTTPKDASSAVMLLALDGGAPVLGVPAPSVSASPSVSPSPSPSPSPSQGASPSPSVGASGGLVAGSGVPSTGAVGGLDVRVAPSPPPGPGSPPTPKTPSGSPKPTPPAPPPTNSTTTPTAPPSPPAPPCPANTATSTKPTTQAATSASTTAPATPPSTPSPPPTPSSTPTTPNPSTPTPTHATTPSPDQTQAVCVQNTSATRTTAAPPEDPGADLEMVPAGGRTRKATPGPQQKPKGIQEQPEDAPR